MQMDTLLTGKMTKTRLNRWFGGSKTDTRRRKCIAYAWRQHQRSGSAAPFWFSVTKGKYRDPKTGREVPTVGRGRVIGFVTATDRKRSIPFLRAMGYDNFVEFRDVNATFALQIGQSQAREARGTLGTGKPTPQPLKPGAVKSFQDLSQLRRS